MNKTFGDILRTERKAKELSQIELGKLLNLSKQTISGYENNSSFPSQETLLKLSDIFSVSTDYLLGKSDERNPSKSSDEIVTKAFSLKEGVTELPQEALDQIDEYIRLLKLKYKDKK
ncbi:MAG: helix-turn-helix domain-containing protein [Tissierellales bacterium]|nr:helix-turn-helix domain-containing protein [Tissierellales bacterium]